MSKPLFRQSAHFGSATPFQHAGACHLFARLPKGIGHLVSTDLLNWTEAPMAIDYSDGATDDALDSACSIVEHGGLFHLFYSLGGEVHLATSPDLDTWSTHPASPVLSDSGAFYSDEAIRDPAVLYMAEEGRFWMLFSARVSNQPAGRAACVGWATSKNLSRWELHTPLWMPGSEAQVREPQLIETARGRWHLLYRDRRVHVRLANAPGGPFRRPPVHDILDGRTGGGTRATKREEGWLIFPHLPGDEATMLATPRLLRSELDGSLSDQPAPSLVAGWRQNALPIELLLGCRTPIGRWEQPEPDRHTSTAQSGGVLLLPQLHGDCFAELEVTANGADTDINLLLRVGDELTGGLLLTIDSRAQQLTLRAVDEDDAEPLQAVRYTPLSSRRPIRIDLVLCGGFVELFINKRISLSGSLTGDGSGACAVEFVNGGGSVRLVGARRLRQETAVPAGV